MSNENANQPAQLTNKNEIEYHVRWRHIPPYLMMTPLMLISVDHTRVFSKRGANEWDIQCAVSKEVGAFLIAPEYVSIESFEII